MGFERDKRERFELSTDIKEPAGILNASFSTNLTSRIRGVQAR
jgi:hypothetical protein